MAVETTLQLKDFRGGIEVKGPADDSEWTPAEVFKLDAPIADKATGYVISQHGQQFRMVAQDMRTGSRRNSDAAIQLSVDGRIVCNMASRRGSPPGKRIVIDGRRNGTSIQYLYFSNLILTDSDDLACKEEKIINDAGSMLVAVHRARLGHLRKSIEGEDLDTETLTFSEKDKKAYLTHSTSIGKAVTCADPGEIITTYLDSIATPLATFEFKYRSRDMLEAEGTVEHKGNAARELEENEAAISSASPTTAEKKQKKGKGKRPSEVIDIDSDEESEVQRLRREMAALRKKLKMGEQECKTKGQTIDLT